MVFRLSQRAENLGTYSWPKMSPFQLWHSLIAWSRWISIIPLNLWNLTKGPPLPKPWFLAQEVAKSPLHFFSFDFTYFHIGDDCLALWTPPYRAQLFWAFVFRFSTLHRCILKSTYWFLTLALNCWLKSTIPCLMRSLIFQAIDFVR